MNLKNILIDFLSLFVITVMVKCETPMFYQIGIYSNCTGKANRTQLNIEAGLVRDFNRHLIKEMSHLEFMPNNTHLIKKWSQEYLSLPDNIQLHIMSPTFNIQNFTYDFVYEEYDVCDNITYLAGIVQNLVLSQRYKIQDDQSQAENKSSSSIIDIFMHTHVEMVSFVKSIFNEIPIYDIDYRTQTDGSVYDITDKASEVLVSLVQYFKLKKITLITLTTFDYPFLVYYRKSVDALRELNICLELYHIEPSQVNNETKFLLRIPDLNEKPFVVLYGTDNEQREFLKSVGDFFPPRLFFPIINTYYLGMNFDYIELTNYDLFFQTQAQNTIKSKFDWYLTETYNNLPNHIKFAVLQNIYGYSEELDYFPYGELFKLSSKFSSFREDQDHRKTGIMYFTVSIRLDGVINDIGSSVMDDRSTIDWTDRQIYYHEIRDFLTRKENLSSCEIPTCTPGYQRVYSNVTNGFSWICNLCPKNTFKPLSGDDICATCIGRFNIDNGKRTACIDPYIIVHIDFAKNEFIFLVVLSLFGMLLTLCTLIVFVVRRKTPIVSVSDFGYSITHMVIIFLSFVATLSSFIGKPDFHKCILRIISFNLFYVIIIGIVFVKSQKLLLAFSSKVKLVAEEIKRTKFVQIFTIIIFLISVNSLFGIVIYLKDVRNTEALDAKTMTSFHYCDNSFHFNVLIASTMVIQLMCSIQAFRGRNLPSVMNDGIVLMYATFTLTIVFGVSFVIVNAQPAQMKELFQWIAVTINNVVIVFLMYTQKALRMLFFPERNTREYFQQERMRERRQNVNEAMEMR